MNALTQGNPASDVGVGPFGFPPELGSYTTARRRHPLWKFHELCRRSAVRPVNVLCLGDSVTEGANASAAPNKWTWLLREEIRDHFGVSGGLGFIRAGDVPSNLSTYMANAGGSTNTTFGVNRMSRQLAGSGASVTFTVTGTDFDVCYVRSSGGGGTNKISYVVDGAPAVEIVTDGASAATDATTTRISGLSAGAHTIVIEWVAGLTYLGGLICYDGDTSSGIRVWDAGRSGLTSSSFASLATDPWARYVSQIFQPDLVILEIGINDARNYLTPANQPEGYRSSLRSTVAAVNSLVDTDPLWVLVSSHQPTGTVSAYHWDRYIESTRVVAAEVGGLHLDVWGAWGRLQPSLEGRLDTDQIHPTDAGHAQKAELLADLILPRSSTHRYNKA